MDTAKRASSLNIGIMDEAMRSFGAQLPELDMHFPEEKEVYQALAFYGKEYEDYFDDRYSKLRFVRWHENSVDVVPKDGSKAATILSVAHQLGISQKDVICFGDGQKMIAKCCKLPASAWPWVTRLPRFKRLLIKSPPAMMRMASGKH